MSRHQWKQLHMAERVREGRVTNAEAARALGLSGRQWRRVRQSIETRGDEAVRHGNTGRHPPNRLSEAVRDSVLRLAQGRYAGFDVRLDGQDIGAVDSAVWSPLGAFVVLMTLSFDADPDFVVFRMSNGSRLLIAASMPSFGAGDTLILWRDAALRYALWHDEAAVVGGANGL